MLLDGADESARADVSPVTHVRAGAPPFLLVHGTADEAVPYAQSESLLAALEAVGADVLLEEVPGAGHIFHNCADLDAVLGRSVDYLAGALLSGNG